MAAHENVGGVEGEEVVHVYSELLAKPPCPTVDLRSEKDAPVAVLTNINFYVVVRVKMSTHKVDNVPCFCHIKPHCADGGE